MKNLENFNVAPMSQKEMRDTEGGFFWFLAVAVTISLVVAGGVALGVAEATKPKPVQPGN